jgi:hypothetical protein
LSGARAAHAARRVVAGESRQVGAGRGARQPSGLMVLLDRAAPRQARRAALDGAIWLASFKVPPAS